VGAAVKGFMFTGIMPLQKYFVPDEIHAPSTLFQLHGIEQEGNATEKNTSSHQAQINRVWILFTELLFREINKKVDWICCQVCKTWYHELCVGAFIKRPLPVENAFDRYCSSL
jgi:hypothetical protein